MFLINPPPTDGACEICGRPASELQPFDEEIAKAKEDYQEKINEGPEKVVCILSYITPDRKLVKNFRNFFEDSIEPSWECSDCLQLSDDDAQKVIAHCSSRK
jgi:hypothetical protein